MIFVELIDKYVEEVILSKGGVRLEVLWLNWIVKIFLGVVLLEELSKVDFEKW